MDPVKTTRRRRTALVTDCSNLVLLKDQRGWSTAELAFAIGRTSNGVGKWIQNNECPKMVSDLCAMILSTGAFEESTPQDAKPPSRLMIVAVNDVSSDGRFLAMLEAFGAEIVGEINVKALLNRQQAKPDGALRLL